MFAYQKNSRQKLALVQIAGRLNYFSWNSASKSRPPLSTFKPLICRADELIISYRSNVDFEEDSASLKGTMIWQSFYSKLNLIQSQTYGRKSEYEWQPTLYKSTFFSWFQIFFTALCVKPESIWKFQAFLSSNWLYSTHAWCEQRLR